MGSPAYSAHDGVKKSRPIAWPRGVWGVSAPPHLCQDGAQDFLKIDEKTGVGNGEEANLPKSRGCGQKLSSMSPHFLSPCHAPGQGQLYLYQLAD